MDDSPNTRKIRPEAFKLLEDETRRRIVFMLREETLTVKEIAKRLGMTPQNIYHHMNKLEDNEIVEMGYERREGHLIESYYQTTSENLIYNEDWMPQDPVKSYLDILNGLNELNHNIIVNNETAEEIKKLHEAVLSNFQDKTVQIQPCDICSFSGFFMKFGPLNPVLLKQILEFAGFLDMKDEQFDQYLASLRNLRYYLFKIKKSGFTR
jgi:DNA-binding transcriptional ArsR family regulator